MGLMTARQFEKVNSEKKEETIERTEKQDPIPPEPTRKYFLIHPDSVDGDMTCDFQIEVEGTTHSVSLVNGRTVITNDSLALALMKRGYREYRHMEEKICQ